jgi:hypothetical protein
VRHGRRGTGSGDSHRRQRASEWDSLIEAVAEDGGRALAGYAGDAGLTFPQEVHVALASR